MHIANVYNPRLEAAVGRLEPAELSIKVDEREHPNNRIYAMCRAREQNESNGIGNHGCG
jgi:hypothetical protein